MLKDRLFLSGAFQVVYKHRHSPHIPPAGGFSLKMYVGKKNIHVFSKIDLGVLSFYFRKSLMSDAKKLKGSMNIFSRGKGNHTQPSSRDQTEKQTQTSIDRQGSKMSGEKAKIFSLPSLSLVSKHVVCILFRIKRTSINYHELRAPIPLTLKSNQIP